MILILSDNSDQTTNDVIDWIIYYKHDFVRVNDSNKCSVTGIVLNDSTSDATLTIQNRELRFSMISSYWYRRGNFTFEVPSFRFNNNFIFKDNIRQNLWQEIRSLSYYLHSILKRKYGLGSFLENDINKLENLTLAKEIGLLIPETLITSNSDKVIDFINNKNEIITKAISEAIIFPIEGEGAIQSYTNIVKKNNLESFNEMIFPSLFQRSINKKYELRIFYLDSDFYSMAIFSQSNIKTKTDFRNYDENKPNRCVPFTLPLDIKNKLDLFMRRKNYKTGSIDMLVDHNDNFIFLEVNPIGQFGMTSYPCNYYLEKKVAEYLCKIN